MERQTFFPALLLHVLTLPPIITLGQTVQNSGFEAGSAGPSSLPVGWSIKPWEAPLTTMPDSTARFTVQADGTEAKQGRKSVRITRLAGASDKFQGFGQSCAVRVNQPTTFHLRASVYANQPTDAFLWYELWDETKQIGSATSSQFGQRLDTTGAWRELMLPVLATADVRRVVIGGGMWAEGSVWFDDVRFEPIARPKTPPSAKVTAYLDSAITLVQRYALVRDSIPWPQTKATMLTFAAGMQTEQEAHPVINYLLDVLYQYGDKHSHFQSPTKAQSYSAAQPAQGEAPPQPSGTYLGNGIGYVAVPGFGSVNETRSTDFATTIQNLIRQIDQQQSISGWIVDLRKNGGGNMYPMIAGLGPLTGEDTLGYFIIDKQVVPWAYYRGEAYFSKPGRGASVKTPYQLRNTDARVAVLIGPETASSGEMTAMSFIGRRGTRLFGLPSGGYTTANRRYKLPDGASLILAGSVSVDRHRKQYLRGLVPDEEIKAPATTANDPTVDAAKAWLMK